MDLLTCPFTSPHISLPIHGLYIGNAFPLVLQLAPQSVNRDREGILIHILRAVRPEPVHKHGTGQNPALILQKKSEQSLFIFAE